MAGIWIDEHFEIINSKEDFFRLINEKIGHDGEQLGRQIFEEIKTDNCAGECDYVYREQERYERMFRDFLEDLSTVKVLKNHQRYFSNLLLKYRKDFGI